MRSGTETLSADVLVGLDRAAGRDLTDDREACACSVSARWSATSAPMPGASAAAGLSRIARDCVASRSSTPSRLERGEVVVDGRRRRKTDGGGDLPHRRRIAAGSQTGRRCTR